MTIGPTASPRKSGPEGDESDRPTARRRYSSPRRRQQAAATQAAIAAAARRLFIERGWAGTTMRAVAEAAGVSEPTVFNVYGSKAGLANALVDAVALGADVERQGAELAAADGDPAGELAAMIGFDRRLYEGGADVLVALRDGGRSEPALTQAYAHGRTAADELRHRIISGWSTGTLAPGIDHRTAVDTYAALCNIDVYRVLTLERGWHPDRVEQWLLQTLTRLLLN